MEKKNLQNLKDLFSPHRFYFHIETQTTIEVDGVFVRIDESLVAQQGKDSVEIPLEDFLQDPAIIRSARVSTDRDTKAVEEKAIGLVSALHRDHHETPSEGAVMFRLRITTPICYAQPFFQLAGSHNEFSGRYSVIDGPLFKPPFNNPRFDCAAIGEIYEESERDCKEAYEAFLAFQVAREQARLALPFSFFTKFYWTTSLRHVVEFLSLEKHSLLPGAFWNLRDKFKDILKDWTPWAYESMEKYQADRIVPTAWYETSPSLSAINQSITLLKHHALRREYIKDVGEIHLLKIEKEAEFLSLLHLGVLTKPNPRRGFGHVSASYLIECPIFVHRQWVRHRYGSWSELPSDFDAIVTGRNFYIPVQFRKQIGKAMGYVFEDASSPEDEKFKAMLLGLIERACLRYRRLRVLGLLPEQAAQVLPYTFRVSTIWTANFESLMNFFSLRCDVHAQWETRQYANVILGWFKEYAPWSYGVFINHLNWGKSPLFDPKD